MIKMKNKVLGANLIFVLVSILFITLGSYAQSINVKMGVLFTEYIILLVPAVIYLIARKKSIRKSLSIRSISFSQLLTIVGIAIFTVPLALFANYLMIYLMSTFNLRIGIPPVPTATTSKEYLSLLFIISISAGVCEELFFRGFMLGQCRGLGKGKNILFTAFLFGLLHFNLANLLSPILLGCLFGYMVYTTGSIFSSMIAHMVHNGIIVTYMYVMQKYYGDLVKQAKSTGVESLVDINVVISLFVVALIFGGIVFALLRLLKRVSRNRSFDSSSMIFAERVNSLKVYLPLIIPIALYIYYNIRFVEV